MGLESVPRQGLSQCWHLILAGNLEADFRVEAETEAECARTGDDAEKESGRGGRELQRTERHLQSAKGGREGGNFLCFLFGMID